MAIEVSFFGDVFGFVVVVLGFGRVFGGGRCLFVGFSSTFLMLIVYFKTCLQFYQQYLALGGLCLYF